MTQIHPYLTFEGNCREAMLFYRDCFGGELTLETIGGSPMESQFPPEARQRILHSKLCHRRLVLMGSDVAGDNERIKGNTISLSLQCDSPDEIKSFFRRLSDGGQVAYPLQEFYSGMMGALTDKFEKDWLLFCETNSHTSQKS